MTVTDELVSNAEAYAASFTLGDLPLPPAKGVAIVACMDARLNKADPLIPVKDAIRGFVYDVKDGSLREV